MLVCVITYLTKQQKTSNRTDTKLRVRKERSRNTNLGQFYSSSSSFPPSLSPRMDHPTHTYRHACTNHDACKQKLWRLVCVCVCVCVIHITVHSVAPRRWRGSHYSPRSSSSSSSSLRRRRRRHSSNKPGTSTGEENGE